VERAFGRIKKRFPELRSLTLDNDILFIHHERLGKKFKIKNKFNFICERCDYRNKDVRDIKPLRVSDVQIILDR
jgi:hypothetical protein